MTKLRIVEDNLENLKNVSSQAELMDSMNKFNNSALELMAQAAKRQHELMDPALRYVTVHEILRWQKPGGGF